MDTQLPSFEIFEQERPGQPHRNAGSLHAADLEMALLNARDVFVRRPACLSLWVVPASAIYSRTAEELASRGSVEASAPSHQVPSANREPYQVFAKTSQRQAETFVVHAGTVEAGSPAEALELARAQFGDKPVFVWWVVPERAILRSDPAEAASLFEPATTKPYRSPNFYHVLTQMRQVRAETSPADPAPANNP